jgi:hypothetical protein
MKYIALEKLDPKQRTIIFSLKPYECMNYGIVRIFFLPENQFPKIVFEIKLLKRK